MVGNYIIRYINDVLAKLCSEACNHLVNVSVLSNLRNKEDVCIRNINVMHRTLKFESYSVIRVL